MNMDSYSRTDMETDEAYIYKGEGNSLSLTCVITRRKDMLIPRWLWVFVGCCCIPMAYVLLFSIIRDLVLNPQRPVFQIDSAAMSQLDVTSAGELKVSMDLKVLVINPNVKLDIELYSIEAMLFYLMVDDRRERLLLAAKPVTPPFFLITGNRTTVTFKLSTSKKTFVQDEVGNAISEAKARHGGFVRFQMRMLAYWNYRRFHTRGFFKTSMVLCPLLEFGTENGTLTVNSSRACVERSSRDSDY